MLTDSQIRAGYIEKHGIPMSEDSLTAFKQMVYAFDALDSETYDEAAEKISASLEDIANELGTLPDGEVYPTLMRRYGERLLDILDQQG